MDIGKKVKSLRKEAHLTQKEFAVRVGLGLKTIRDLEQGKKSTRMYNVNQILAFFGCHLEVVKDEQRT